VLGKMLAQDGYEVLKAVDGESAVTLAQAQLPDLIFLDIVLPGISGFAVLRALRRDSRTRTTPIVMMSGNQQATEQFYVQRFGADGFVKKPFGRVEVFQAIRALVQARRISSRMIVPAQSTEIPEGISPEEWAAIPDVAMPDDEHTAPEPVVSSERVAADVRSAPSTESPPVMSGDGSSVVVPAPPVESHTKLVDAEPVRAPAADPPASGGETAITGAAVSTVMRPTLIAGMHATPGPMITVHVARLNKFVAETANDSTGVSAEQPREGRDG
ncbi:MAG: response regulator, partial [Rhodanobacteraceae bacterium]